jgi:hypothetical protein
LLEFPAKKDKPSVRSYILLGSLQLLGRNEALAYGLGSFPPGEDVVGAPSDRRLFPFEISLEVLLVDGPSSQGPDGTNFLQDGIPSSLNLLNQGHGDLHIVDYYLQ